MKTNRPTAKEFEKAIALVEKNHSAFKCTAKLDDFSAMFLPVSIEGIPQATPTRWTWEQIKAMSKIIPPTRNK